MQRMIQRITGTSCSVAIVHQTLERSFGDQSLQHSKPEHDTNPCHVKAKIFKRTRVSSQPGLGPYQEVVERSLSPIVLSDKLPEVVWEFRCREVQHIIGLGLKDLTNRGINISGW